MTYLQRIRHLYNVPDNEVHGFPESEIVAMEKQLNIVLPAKLREYYLILGTHEAINYSHNRLLRPAQMHFSEDGYLVFYEENQGVVYWGIKKADLLNANPPVYGGYTSEDGNANWYLELPTTETSLLMLAVYNGVLGGLKYNANCLDPVNSDVVGYIKSNWQELEDISSNTQRIYTKDGLEMISLSFDSDRNCSAIFIGTNDQARFDNMVEHLKVEWFYMSTEDMDEEED